MCAAGRAARPCPGEPADRPADLVDRDFTATAPNRLWLADFTYVATWSGVVYVAFIIDAYSRRIVGWKADTNMRTSLVLDTLEMALWSRDRAGLPVEAEAIVSRPDWGKLKYRIVGPNVPPWYASYPETGQSEGNCRGTFTTPEPGMSTACDEYPFWRTEQGGDHPQPHRPHLKIIDWWDNSKQGSNFWGLCHRLPTPKPPDGAPAVRWGQLPHAADAARSRSAVSEALQRSCRELTDGAVAPDAPLLTRELLDSFEAALRSVAGDALAGLSAPGANDGRLAAAESELDVPLSLEARRWWSWHDADDVELLPGVTLVSLRAAVHAYRVRREQAAEIASTDALGTHPQLRHVDRWWDQRWIPILGPFAHAVVALDCDPAGGPTSAVRIIDWSGIGLDDYAAPVAESLGALVTHWTSQLTAGAYVFDQAGGQWKSAPSPATFHLSTR